MNKLSTWIIAIFAALSMTWEAESVALAEEYQCTGPVGTELLDNIFVPDGKSCTLDGTQAKGTVKVGTGSTLIAKNIKVNGNIQAEGATIVDVSGISSVGGSIQIKQGKEAKIVGVKVTGDIQFDDNSGPILADGNIVGGNVQVIKNRGGLTIQNNVIDGNLQCKENNPAPTGGKNQAASLEDQCASLAGSITPTKPGTGLPAPGGDGECQGEIGALRFENLFVPDGKSCTLNGTRVDGNIKVGTNSSLKAVNIIVGGNIQAEGATMVDVSGTSSVGGSIQIKQGKEAKIDRVKVTGDIQFDDNSGPLLAVNNTVGGNLQVVGNSGGTTLSSNTMNGNLQCKENTPAPEGGNNHAASLEDQCADMSMSISATSFTNKLFIPGIR